MARVVKDADVRREELLDTALALFLEHGYDRTSVEQITTTVGVAKGTFYHYFATKQDLLEQLVTCYTDDLFAEIEKALAATSGSALDCFRALIAASGNAKMRRRDETMMLTRSLYSPENRALLDRLQEGWIDRTRPMVRAIVEQGTVQEGTFDVPDPKAMTEIWLSLWFDYGIRLARLFFEAQDDPSRIGEVVSATKALELAEERILGLEPGSLDMYVEDAVRAVLEGD